MKLKTIFLSSLILLFVTGCTRGERSSVSTADSSNTDIESTESSETSESTSASSSSSSSSSSSTGPTKITVPAHTLSDSNPPINPDSNGQQVTKATWDSFRNGGTSVFNGNYNYTYRAWSLSGESLREQYTKNGYYMKSTSGKLYYERKNGNTFYQYIERSDGYLRQETTLDLQSKYTDRWRQEVYVHMYDFEDYEYIEEAGYYYYPGNGFCYTATFQGGYLTGLYAYISGYYFEINASFETTIDIPKSYYYE